MIVHCPFCAQPLTVRDGVLHCDAAEDDFSEWASAEILRGMDGSRREIPELRAQPVTRLHCPRCAARMHRAHGEALGAQCARCGYEVRPALEHGFVELRTHPYSEEERDEHPRMISRRPR